MASPPATRRERSTWISGVSASRSALMRGSPRIGSRWSRKARMVLWPSAYDGGFPLWAYAYIHHYWVVSSTRAGHSRIIDPCGAVLHQTDSSTSVISRNVNLDYLVYHWDWNGKIADQIRAKYGDRVAVRVSEPGCATASSSRWIRRSPRRSCRRSSDSSRRGSITTATARSTTRSARAAPCLLRAPCTGTGRSGSDDPVSSGA